ASPHRAIKAKTGGVSGVADGCSISVICCRSPVRSSFCRGASSAAAARSSHRSPGVAMTAAMIAAEAGVAAAPQENLLHPSRWPSWMTTPREAHASSAAKSPAATQKTNQANAPADHAAPPAPSRRN
ncbi:uncharacterized protein METZ01_LOCUS293399, partial [marine metagenome]